MRTGRMAAVGWVLCLLAGCEPPPADALVADAAADLDRGAPDARAPRPDAAPPPTDDFGEACTASTDCRSGFCVVTDDDPPRACTRACGDDTDCPAGWLCRQVTNAEADVTFICVPRETPCGGADLQTDPAHCGACGRTCERPGAQPRCVDGACADGPCLAGLHDLDGDATNGCEYPCTLTLGGDEACDTIDNDCDGRVDEGVDLRTDAAHCGACNRPCAPTNAQGACVDGDCAVAACAPGFEDADGDPANGCEQTRCRPDDTPERCDGTDDDCDGTVDEGFDLQTDPAHCGACAAACAPPNADGVCSAGVCSVAACAAGHVDLDGRAENGCEYACAPVAANDATCDGRDDDCDGATDEEVDLGADPAHCGACGATCVRAAATTACREGRCVLLACDDGHRDEDGDPDNGCEVGCVPIAEQCNATDDDCDGAIDEDFDLAGDPDHCGACGAACAFSAAAAVCVDGACRLGPCAPGAVDLDGDPDNGCEYLCVPTLGGDEACDTIDNDCDGAVDEAFDLARDVDHCGACGARCAPPNAVGACVDGACTVDLCRGTFRDTDGAPDNGCEDGCTPSNGGVEVCDGVDDDCDRAVDEGFDLQTDDDHCGGCGRACAPADALGLCVAGACTVAACAPGFVDLDGLPANGCEYACEVAGDEVCNDADDDCDGRTDEGFDLQRDPSHCGACDTPCAFDQADAACQAGRCVLTLCRGGFVNLDGDPTNGCECAVAPESCNDADDDCDGRTDEGFDLVGDPAHCGACGRVCDLPDATAACVNRQCRVDGCTGGRVDLDGDPANGCECRPAPESCNDADDDCDGRVDEGFDLVSDPAHCGACGRVCDLPDATAACVNRQCRVDGCTGGRVDLDGDPANGCECAPTPETCDAADEDCDGRTDEGFDLQGDPSNCGACGRVCDLPSATAICVTGQCRVDACTGGRVDLDQEPANGCECQPAPETCDAADDDCDGRVDEGFDLQGDPAHCGACGRVCDLPRAVAGCALGACTVEDCADGFLDADGEPANGCELDCTQGPAPGCPVEVPYPGTYDLAPAIGYTCVDVFIGETAYSLSMDAVTLALAGMDLTAAGAPTALRQSPAPSDGTFRLTGTIPGGPLGCTEDYTLVGAFDDADAWSGVLELRFRGDACGFTTCTARDFVVTGTRRE